MAKTETGKRGARATETLRYARPGKPAKRRRPAKPSTVGPALRNLLGKINFQVIGRSLKMVLMGLLTVAGLLLVSGILVAGYLYISKSDYFAVKRVTISGISQTSRDEILTAAGLDRPANILTFDAGDATAAVSALPWLEEVKISRQMPDTVAIEIKEHHPKVLVNLGRLYYLNERGEPFREVASGENPPLPILTGFKDDDLLSPGPRVKAALTEVFWLVDTLGQRNDEFRLDNISEVNYDMVRGLTLFTKNNQLEVKIGFGAYEEKFRRLGRVMAYLKLRNEYDGLAYLNLEASPRVTVRYHNGQVLQGSSAAVDGVGRKPAVS